MSFAPAAYCPVHGVVRAGGISLSHPMRNHRYVGAITNCPHCDRDIEIIPGTYNEDSEGLNILLDPSISPEALRALLELAQKVQKGEITVEEADRAAGGISEKFANIFANMSDTMRSAIVASLITGLLAIVSSQLSSPEVVVNVNPVAVMETIQPTDVYPNLPETGPLPKRRTSPTEERLRNSTALSLPAIPIPTPKPRQ